MRCAASAASASPRAVSARSRSMRSASARAAAALRAISSCCACAAASFALPALRGFGGVRLFANRLCTLVLDTFGFRPQPGERAGHEDMGRAELFQPRDRRLPVPSPRIRGGRCQRRHAPGARGESVTSAWILSSTASNSGCSQSASHDVRSAA